MNTAKTSTRQLTHKNNQLLFIQTVFSTVVLIFCMYQIIMNKSSETLSLYWGGMMSILGYWFPSPLDGKK
jgi:hypothetical protein